MPCSVETRYGRFRVRHPSLLPHVMQIVRSLDAVVERRGFCPTGAGGGIDNSCPTNSGGGVGATGAGTASTGFSRWRESNRESLDRLRSGIVSSRQIADDIASDQESRRQAAFADHEKAYAENDAIKQKLDPARRKLRDALVQSAATQEDADRWQRENLFLIDKSVRPKDLAGSEQARAAFDDLQSLKSRREAALAAMTKHQLAMEEADAFSRSVRRDAAKDAWQQIGARGKEFAVDDSKDGLGYRPDLYASDLDRFSEAVRAIPVSHSSGDRQHFDGVKKDVDEFVTSAISPVSWSGEAVRQATVVVDQKNTRAFCSDKEINLHPLGSATTYTHELGHVLESQPLVKKAAIAFHASRCRPEDEVSLRDRFPDSGYHPSERGNPDRFAKAIRAVYGDGEHVDADMRAHYVGKVYRDAGSNTKATEVVSMGLQMMYDNPAAFASADPEYFDFMVGIMTGAERRFKENGSK